MSVIRVKKRSTPYVTLNTTALNDARLSFRAKGLHTYLMSKPDDWRVYITQLEKESPKEGREAIAGAIKELEAAGYIQRARLRGEKGRMAGWDTTIYETPELASLETPPAENGFADFGSTEIGLSEVGCTEVGKPVATYKGLNQELIEPKIEESHSASFPSERTTRAKKRVLPKQSSPKVRPSKFLPDTFTLTDELRAWAQHDVPGLNLDFETNKMRDWEFKTPHTDWIKAWRNWMRHAWERLPAEAKRSPLSKAQPFKVVL